MHKNASLFGVGNGAQGLVNARQAVYQLSHTQSSQVQSLTNQQAVLGWSWCTLMLLVQSLGALVPSQTDTSPTATVISQVSRDLFVYLPPKMFPLLWIEMQHQVGGCSNWNSLGETQKQWTPPAPVPLSAQAQLNSH